MLSESSRATLRWLDKWQLNPSDDLSFNILFFLVSSTCLFWRMEPERRSKLEPYPGYTLKPTWNTPKKIPPPKFQPGESDRDYLERAKHYYAVASFHHKKKTGQKITSWDAFLARSDRYKDAPKRTTEHYRWAACWQCHPNGKEEAEKRFEGMSERQVRRTLKECGLSGQKSPIFDI